MDELTVAQFIAESEYAWEKWDAALCALDGSLAQRRWAAICAIEERFTLRWPEEAHRYFSERDPDGVPEGVHERTIEAAAKQAGFVFGVIELDEAEGKTYHPPPRFRA